MARHHDKQLPFGIVPVLAFGNAGFADVDGYLAAIRCVDKLCERAPVIDVHLKAVPELLSRKIGQVKGIQLLCKGALRHPGHQQCFRLGFKPLQQIHDLTQRHFMRHRDAAVTAIRLYHRIHAVKLAVDLFSFQKVKHPFHQVVNIKKFQFGTPVIYSKWLIVCHRPAEGADGAVVLWPGMPHQIWEAVDRCLRSGLLAILEEQLLSGFLASSVLRIVETPGQCRLDRTGEHDACLIVILLQSIQKNTGKSEVFFHKVLRIFRHVHTGKIEYEVSFLAVCIQLLLGSVQIIFICLIDVKTRSCPVFPSLIFFRLATRTVPAIHFTPVTKMFINLVTSHYNSCGYILDEFEKRTTCDILIEAFFLRGSPLSNDKYSFTSCRLSSFYIIFSITNHIALT